MVNAISSAAKSFSNRLCEHPADQLEAFATDEIISGLPAIFARNEDMILLQEYVATKLGISNAANDVLIVGSAKMGFSLDPDRYFVPFQESSDIDIVVVHEGLFDEAWRIMLAWDYLTINRRTKIEQQWLYRRHDEVWSGWYDLPGWHFRERGGIELSFPNALKPLRDLAFQWFSTFRSLSRYKHHPEIPRHKASARLYRSRLHVAMYHAMGLRVLRSRLLRLE
jgi:hypothetical protein